METRQSFAGTRSLPFVPRKGHGYFSAADLLGRGEDRRASFEDRALFTVQPLGLTKCACVCCPGLVSGSDTHQSNVCLPQTDRLFFFFFLPLMHNIGLDLINLSAPLPGDDTHRDSSHRFLGIY